MEILKLGCILPNLANICLHNSTDYKFFPLFLSDSDLFEKKTGRYDRWSLNYFLGKQLQTKRLFENQTIYVNQTLISMLVNSILILCVRICPHACIRDETTMKKHKNSRQDKIEINV